MIDATNLYKWAFKNFEMATVVNKDEQLTEVKVEMGESATHTRKRLHCAYAEIGKGIGSAEGLQGI